MHYRYYIRNLQLRSEFKSLAILARDLNQRKYPALSSVDTVFHWEQSCRHSQKLWLLRNHCYKQQRGDQSHQDTSVSIGDRNTVKD